MSKTNYSKACDIPIKKARNSSIGYMMIPVLALALILGLMLGGVITPLSLFGPDDQEEHQGCNGGINIQIKDFYIDLWNNTEKIERNSTFRITEMSLLFMNMENQTANYIKNNPDTWNETINGTNFDSYFSEEYMSVFNSSNLMQVMGMGGELNNTNFDNHNITIPKFPSFFIVGIMVLIQDQTNTIELYISADTIDEFENMTSVMNSPFAVFDCNKLQLEILGMGYNQEADEFLGLYVNIGGQFKNLTMGMP